MQTYNITLPFDREQIKQFKSGDLLYLTGYIYTARDAAHVRLQNSLDAGKCDLDLTDQVIYYVGPTPAFDQHVIGSAGPTTSTRMDRYTPDLMAAGLVATIGKGDRDQAVIEACKTNKGLYLVTTGGVGALLSNQITEYEEIMYQDLGPESLKRLKLENFPVFVAYDTEGNDIFN